MYLLSGRQLEVMYSALHTRMVNLVAYLSGVIVHEAAHRFFAMSAKIPVYQVCYFRLGNPAGFVIHGPTNGLRNSFLVSVGPLMVNTALCAIVTLPGFMALRFMKDGHWDWIPVLILWLGFSIGMHAFPSNDDMRNFVNDVKTTKGEGVLLVVSRMAFWLIILANTLRIVWFDAIYAICIGLLLPVLLGIL